MFEIAPARQEDCQSISDIYNYFVLNSTATFAVDPEPVSERQAWLNQHNEKGLPVFVARLDGVVVGFASLSFYHQRCAYKQTVEASIYIDNAHLSKGYGRKLMEVLMTAARSGGYHVMLGLICSENTASIKLMKDFQFFEVGVLRQVGRKYDRWLDVTILEKILEQ